MQVEAPLKSRYKDVGQRLGKYSEIVRKPSQTAVVIELRPEPKAPPISQYLPYWIAKDTQFDAHLIDWQEWKARYSCNSRRYLKDRAIELGFTYEALIPDDRRDPQVMARSLLMWELKTYFGRSLAEICRLFGGRDHSTVFYAIRKVSLLKAEGKL